jgi:RHS repeat-associated protein
VHDSNSDNFVSHQNDKGQLVQQVLSDGSHTDYTYDANGNVTAATDASGTTTLTYSPNNLLQQITYPDGKFLQFTYDSANRRSSSVDQDGFKTLYVYDTAGRLWKLEDAKKAFLVKYTYDKAGRVSRKDDANGTYTTYVYDAAGRVLSLVNHGPKGVINSQYDYTYNAAGQTATMTTGGVTTTYGYDLDGQLTSVVTPTRTITYTYDAAGNRTSVTDNGVTTIYTVNELNEVTAAGSTAYSYDADGNLTSMTDGSGTTNYTWNDLNQLTGVASPTDTIANTYDAFGQLFATTENGQTTTNLNDPLLGAVAAQYNSGGLLAHYLTGVGLEARIAAVGSKAFYDFDKIGNVVGLTSSAGTYVNKYSYLPFGETTSDPNNSIANPFTYIGQFGVSTDASGLMKMGARWYNSAVGGFVSNDPIGFAGGDWNIRRYVGNDPLDGIDPTGLSCGDDDVKKMQHDIDTLNKDLQNIKYFEDYYSKPANKLKAIEIRGADAVDGFLNGMQQRKADDQARLKIVQDTIDDCNKKKKKPKPHPDMKFASPGQHVPGTTPVKKF